MSAQGTLEWRAAVKAGAVAAPFPHSSFWIPATWPVVVRAALCQLSQKARAGPLVLPNPLFSEPLSHYQGSRKKPGAFTQLPQGSREAEQTAVFQAVQDDQVKFPT